MDELARLRRNQHWRMAVWALRVGYAGLAVAVVGLMTRASGSTPWVLAVGVLAWLAAAIVTLTGVFWAWRALPGPRPGFWRTRFMLIYDTVHARPPAGRS
jgi:hypothetical protein